MDKTGFLNRVEQTLQRDAYQKYSERSARFFSSKNEYVLYGAGQLGKSTLEGLTKLGKKVLCFADTTASKWNTNFNGTIVLSPEKAVEKYCEKAVFIPTICLAHVDYVFLKKQLTALGARNIRSFHELFYAFPKTFLPYYHFCAPEQLAEKKENIIEAASLFNDEMSMQHFLSYLVFSMAPHSSTLSPPNPNGYFDPLINNWLNTNTVFLDCGAFDGDTVERFIKYSNNDFKKIIAFEPDVKNFSKLEKRISDLSNAGGVQRIFAVNKAVGQSSEFLKLAATGSEGSLISEDGNVEVEVICLDKFLPEIATKDEQFYIKLDIEGFEKEAIKGSKNMLNNGRSSICACVYHLPEDFYEIPLLLKSINPDFRLYFRLEGEDTMGSVVYAVLGK